MLWWASTEAQGLVEVDTAILDLFCCCCYSVIQLLSCVWFFATLWTADARLPCPCLSPRDCSNSCPLSRWYHPTISFSVIPFSSCPQSFLASGTFPMSWFFKLGGQSIGASASVLSMNIQGWSPSGLTNLISFLSKGFLKVFSSTTIQRHQFLLGNG